MSAVHDSPQPALLNGEPEHWSPKPLGWRLLFNDRLLWLALGLSVVAHIVLLAPRYGIKLPERSDRTINVTFRTASQPIARAAAPDTTVAAKAKPPARERQKPRTAAIKPAPPTTALPSTHPKLSTPQLPPLSPAELLAGSGAPNAGTTGSPSGGRRVTLTPNMKDYRYSQYLSDWRMKVERIGAMNYPEEARGRFFGSLVLSVALRPDGSVDRIIVIRSSGNKVLDDAAKRIVMMAAPFAPFPPDIRKETDYLDITRTWTFTRGDTLESR
jgi:protein TonB